MEIHFEVQQLCIYFIVVLQKFSKFLEFVLIISFCYRVIHLNAFLNNIFQIIAEAKKSSYLPTQMCDIKFSYLNYLTFLFLKKLPIKYLN